jgi:DNA-binding NtrC family response regulator
MQLPILIGASSDPRAGKVADLLARDHEVLRTADLASALRECRRRVPVAAVLPFPGASEEDEVLRFLREQGRRTAVFLFTEAGPPSPGAAYRARAAGARGLLDAAAPDFADDLRRRLTRLPRDRRRWQEEDQALTMLFARHDLAGTSPAMRDVFRRAIKATQFTDLPVLIEGERGTPKRRVASAILFLNPERVRMPFFALDGRDLGKMLGHLGGVKAPTAAEQWQGLLRAARGGTIFLDRLGSLDLKKQSALAAAVCRRPAEVRVIASTERPPEELIANGVLDAELGAWLTLFRIPLPPLRGRPEDIAAQANHVLRAAPAEGTSPARDFEPGVLDRLQRLPWDGNTAELETLVRQALGRARGSALRLEDFPAWVRELSDDASLADPVPHPGDWADEALAMDLAVDGYERRLLRTLLTQQADAEPIRPNHEVG